ncbi:MAG: fused MFS/spermidine synthase [Actinomycetota bacterium]|nr:fused MFS/spermidine synthase [Actinomycetota bacterium]
MVAKLFRKKSDSSSASTEPTGGPTATTHTLSAALAATLVFVASGAVLVLEILAVRLLAPYVGLTLETTTSIIGAALAGIAVGAAAGGWLADRVDERKLLAVLFIVAGLLALLIVPLVRMLGPGARDGGDIAALGVTLITLVPPAAVLSAVTPTVARLRLHNLGNTGSIVGGISAWATAGALVGTFGTGFVLVPLVPISASVLGIGVVLALIGALLAVRTAKLGPTTGVVVVVGTLALGALTATIQTPCDRETDYHCVNVEVDPMVASGRTLLLDDVLHSYVDLDDPAHLEYAYTQWIADGIDGSNADSEPLDVVFVGGGGFTLPRWLQATRPGSTAKVLEVDGDLVEVVREKLGLRENAGLTVAVGDARTTLRDLPTDSADVIVGDAFGTYAVPWHLATTEWAEEVKRVLRPGGLYALNVIDFPPLELLRAEAATLLEVFDDVRLVTMPDGELNPAGGNGILLASDRALPPPVGSGEFGEIILDRDQVVSFAGEAEPLRDDFAPADQQLTIPFD